MHLPLVKGYEEDIKVNLNRLRYSHLNNVTFSHLNKNPGDFSLNRDILKSQKKLESIRNKFGD